MATKYFLMKYSWKCWSKTQFSMKTEILAEALLDVQLLTRLNYLKMSKKLSWIYFIRTVRLCLHLNILRNYFKIGFLKECDLKLYHLKWLLQLEHIVWMPLIFIELVDICKHTHTHTHTPTRMLKLTVSVEFDIFPLAANWQNVSKLELNAR